MAEEIDTVVIAVVTVCSIDSFGRVWANIVTVQKNHTCRLDVKHPEHCLQVRGHFPVL